MEFLWILIIVIIIANILRFLMKSFQNTQETVKQQFKDKAHHDGYSPWDESPDSSSQMMSGKDGNRHHVQDRSSDVAQVDHRLRRSRSLDYGEGRPDRQDFGINSASDNDFGR